MAWLGFGMVAVGGVLVYSAYKNLHPWTEFLAVLKTGALPGPSSASSPGGGSGGEPPPPTGNPQGTLPGGVGGIVTPGSPGPVGQNTRNA